MADIPIVDQYFKVTGADVNRYIIGSGGDSMVAAIGLVLVATTPVGVVATIVARSAVPQAAANNATWLPTAYRRLNVAGAASDGTMVSTALAASGILVIPCPGLMIAVDLTGHTSGTLEFYIKRMTGTAAI